MGQNKYKRTGETVQLTGGKSVGIYLVLGILLSIFTALCIPPIIKEVALFTGLVTLVCVVLYRKTLKARLNLIGVVLVLLVAMTGLSTFYAPNRAIALPEFCSLFIGFCVFILFGIFAGGSAEKRNGGMLVVALSTAVTSLISIDLLSTRIVYQGFSAITGLFTNGYEAVGGIEAGIRMTSLYSAANVFAGVVGIGVLLSLGLAVSLEKKEERVLALVALYLNALAFVLAFSMGATGVIAVAFVVMLFLEKKERRGTLLVLMVETLLFTVLAAVPIFSTSFVMWSEFQPVPLICAVVGSALLCVVHLTVGKGLSERLNQYNKGTTVAVGAVLVLAALFAVIAYNWTGATTLNAGEGLRRAAYPDGGSYTLELECDKPLVVTIESQNKLDTFNHTSSVIYKGDASGATFVVPDDSIVVYFNFSAGEKTNFQSATVVGDGGSIALKLGYKLLPGFMANRLQGLWANENAIQRTAFFEDGLTIFKTSPVFGRGISAFESLFREVQQYDYGTRYVHNHYIQVLLETGLIGLILFLGLLGVTAFALIRLRKSGREEPMFIALMACLVFMVGHACTEVVFSMGTYLVVAMATFGATSLCAGEFVPVSTSVAKGKLPQVVSAGVAVILTAWVLLIGFNRVMPIVMKNTGHGRFLDNLKLAATLDRFDGDDFRYSCIHLAKTYNEDEMVAQAKIYAQDLLKNETAYGRLVDLAEFYLFMGEMDPAMDALTKSVLSYPNDDDVWENGFELLRTVEGEFDDTTMMSAVTALYATFQQCNSTVELSDMTLQQIAAATN